MTQKAINTDAAPKAIGPYNQAIVAGDLVFCSGQVALDPTTNEMVGATAAEQARRALTNLGAVLEAAGTSMDRVVRTTVYLADMADFVAVNEVYAEFFPGVKPARAALAVKTLPKNGLVEIDCIALR
ncbi:MAG: RidA family protein [Planctomycetota bacterium]